jgi:1-aminocyclopropane-1-carboxylate deaminase
MINQLFDKKKKINVQPVEYSLENDQTFLFNIARFDSIHPVISGNKFFKLKYNISKALQERKKGIITMGGAYSNHLIATAHACDKCGLNSIGIIRGEWTQPLNPTLAGCQDNNMKLLSVTRSDFDELGPHTESLIQYHSDYHFVPMGGDNEEGMLGASEMADYIPEFNLYDWIFCAIGSGTMFKGLLKSLLPHQQLTGITVMKLKAEEEKQWIQTLQKENHEKKSEILTHYAGKGFGKAEAEILHLMNDTYEKHKIPLDFVYTAKVFRAMIDLQKKGTIDREKKILMIHSGGLQGNHSLPPGTLLF